MALLALAGSLALARSATALPPPPPPPPPPGGTALVCGLPDKITASCGADIMVDATATPLASTGPIGYTPAQLHKAYSLPNTAPTVKTIGIVDAYDDPTIDSDLGVYSQTLGLPACTIASGCLKKYTQTGATKGFPAADPNWALEISLDVEVAHAICQNCKLVLVEAKSASLADLLTAVAIATKYSNIVSISWGFQEFASETSYDSYFNKSGIPITVSSGDSGYGVEWPASSQYVNAVGGTSLSLASDGTRLSPEVAWSGSGSGCSLYETKPTWQKDTGCAKRTVVDVAAVADPATGAAVYDTTPYQTQTGWFKVGGTSLSAPIVAGVYALAGNSSTTKYGSYPYAHTSGLLDIVSGTNGTCSVAYLCTSGTGYDGPTGLGTPIGVAGF